MEKRTIKVFVSYSNKDMELCTLIMRGLKDHLSQRKDYKYTIWSDGDILAGADWKAQITEKLKESDIALLLVDANFASSSFIGEKELPVFLARMKEEFLIVPILLRKFAFTEFEDVSKLGFFKTYYREYGFNKPTERDELLPFEKLGDNGDITDEQLNTYYHKLATHIHKAVSDKFSSPSSDKSFSTNRFWNRQEERRQLNDLRNEFIYISTPPHCGKTSLLKKLGEEREWQGWYVVFFSLNDLINIKSSEDLFCYIAECLVNNGLEQANYNRIRSLIVNKREKILLLVDDCHLLVKNPTLKQAVLSFFYVLRETFIPRRGHLQLVLAGRYIDSCHFQSAMPLSLVNFSSVTLHPFGQDDIIEIINDLLTEKGIFNDMDMATYMTWSKDIQSISCGHPEASIRLVEHLIARLDSNDSYVLDNNYFSKNEKKLFDECVKPSLALMVNTLSKESLEILESVSVFNVFNIAVILFLKKNGLIPEVTPEDILETLGDLGAICCKSIEVKSDFYGDAILVELLRKDLKLRDFSHYQKINLCAMNFFKELFLKEPKDAGIQYVYHALQTKKTELSIEALKAFHQYITPCNPVFSDITNLESYLLNKGIISLSTEDQEFFKRTLRDIEKNDKEIS